MGCMTYRVEVHGAGRRMQEELARTEMTKLLRKQPGEPTPKKPRRGELANRAEAEVEALRCGGEVPAGAGQDVWDIAVKAGLRGLAGWRRLEQSWREPASWVVLRRYLAQWLTVLPESTLDRRWCCP